MRKRQDQFTFDEAKDYCVFTLQGLSVFSQYLNTFFQNSEFAKHKENLRKLAETVKAASASCLSASEILEVREFGLRVAESEEQLRPKLQEFLKMHEEVLLKTKTEQKEYDMQAFISKMMPRIVAADNLGYDVFDAVEKNKASIMSPTALLLINIIVAESIEYPIVKQLTFASKELGLNNYDVYEMCSVGSKVNNTKGWRTDTRALRDAIAHHQFRIEIANNNWNIEFSNKEEGYDFVRKFSRNEYMSFLQKLDMLYKFQINLLMILELTNMLVIKFLKT